MRRAGGRAAAAGERLSQSRLAARRARLPRPARPYRPGLGARRRLVTLGACAGGRRAAARRRRRGAAGLSFRPGPGHNLSDSASTVSQVSYQPEPEGRGLPRCGPHRAVPGGPGTVAVRQCPINPGSFRLRLSDSPVRSRARRSTAECQDLASPSVRSCRGPAPWGPSRRRPPAAQCRSLSQCTVTVTSLSRGESEPRRSTVPRPPCGPGHPRGR